MRILTLGFRSSCAYVAHRSFLSIPLFWNISSPSRTPLEHAPFAAGYQSLGGNVICRTASTLISVSEYDSPKLLQLIPEDSLLQYRYYGYGYCQALSKPNFAQLEKSPFDVRIFCQ